MHTGRTRQGWHVSLHTTADQVLDRISDVLSRIIFTSFAITSQMIILHLRSRHCRHCRLSSVHWRRNCSADRTTTHTGGNSSTDTSLIRDWTAALKFYLRLVSPWNSWMDGWMDLRIERRWLYHKSNGYIKWLSVKCHPLTAARETTATHSPCLHVSARSSTVVPCRRT